MAISPVICDVSGCLDSISWLFFIFTVILTLHVTGIYTRRGSKEIEMISVRFGSVVLLASLVLGASAQELKKDLDKVGTETKKATKDTGHVIAKDTKTATDKTVDGTKKVYHKTADGTEKVADKTADGTKKAYHKTADGTEKVADKTADGTKKAYHKTAEGTKKAVDKVDGK